MCSYHPWYVYTAFKIFSNNLRYGSFCMCADKDKFILRAINLTLNKEQENLTSEILNHVHSTLWLWERKIKVKIPLHICTWNETISINLRT